MIVGVGTDIVQIDRLDRLLERHGQSAAKKILSMEEANGFCERFGRLENAPGPRCLRQAAVFLAKRFAAKEALSKAFGTGLRAPLCLSAITVRKTALGQPYFHYGPELCDWIGAKRVTAHLSLSDERGYALAFVVLEREAQHR